MGTVTADVTADVGCFGKLERGPLIFRCRQNEKLALTRDNRGVPQSGVHGRKGNGTIILERSDLKNRPRTYVVG